jgi:endonuclease/exonuclease/phosphatase family metal-dependent hydrolase
MQKKSHLQPKAPMVEMPSRSIRVASYNIHGGVGHDKYFVPNRIVDVLGEIDADIIALQEVESRSTGFDMLNFLGNALSLSAIWGPTLLTDNGVYGNGLLTRLPILNNRGIDLSLPNREARGAIDAELQIGLEAGAPALRVIATHLGLHPVERRTQVRKLLSILESDRNLPTVFMGDINEWFLIGRPLRWLHQHFARTPAPATFPARFPLFALDRIWVEPRSLLQTLHAHRSPLAGKASDHLPIVATLHL